VEHRLLRYCLNLPNTSPAAVAADAPRGDQLPPALRAGRDARLHRPRPGAERM